MIQGRRTGGPTGMSHFKHLANPAEDPKRISDAIKPHHDAL
jgi:hypothetical protein